jgi:hypothetical protein
LNIQNGHWAAALDPIAKLMIPDKREWIKKVINKEYDAAWKSCTSTLVSSAIEIMHYCNLRPEEFKGITNEFIEIYF